MNLAGGEQNVLVACGGAAAWLFLVGLCVAVWKLVDIDGPFERFRPTLASTLPPPKKLFVPASLLSHQAYQYSPTYKAVSARCPTSTFLFLSPTQSLSHNHPPPPPPPHTQNTCEYTRNPPTNPVTLIHSHRNLTHTQHIHNGCRRWYRFGDDLLLRGCLQR